MPAFELTRLKKQADELATLFDQPAEFKRLLVDRLEFYADRVTRPGNMAKPVPLILHYGVPPLFLQVVEQSIQKPANENPQSALALAEKLWEEPYLEPRLLAAALIGMAAGNDPTAAAELLVRYCVVHESPLVQEALLQRSGVQLRLANFQVWFDLVERWVNSETLAQQLIGFKALQGVIEDRNFENLPVIYRLLTGPIETTNRATIHDLEPLVTALARRSPVETVFFLRQCYNRSSNVILSRLIRKCLPAFPSEGQINLRQVIQDQGVTRNSA
ncbi:MAG TPA: DNA alkylation repair protein [Leptolinea sp.]